MASLTQTSILARKIIRYSIYAIILIIIARFAIRAGVGIYRRIFPPPKPEPTVAFKKLPKLTLPPKTPPQNLNFTLELASGKLPKLPDQVEVYFMPTSQTSIGVTEDAKTKASKLGFNPQGKVLVETIPNVLVFDKPNLPSKLTMNIVTGVFSISYNIEADPQVLSGVPPDAEAAINQVRGYLNGAGLLTRDLKDAPATHEFLKIEGGRLVSAESLSEADAIKVNLFRGAYGSQKLPSVTPDMPEANVWFILAGGRGKQIIAAEYHYFPIDEKKLGTYPLKTSEAAWEELKEGKGFIANAGENPGGNITIRKVYLAYYDPGQYSAYYQPVIVFEGDNNFYGYVPAVTDEFYGS